jgi:hypothetical protein
VEAEHLATMICPFVETSTSECSSRPSASSGGLSRIKAMLLPVRVSFSITVRTD